MFVAVAARTYQSLAGSDARHYGLKRPLVPALQDNPLRIRILRHDVSASASGSARTCFAGLLTRRENEGRNDGFNEVNLTPIGEANYPRDLTNGNNGIRRRNYIDFSTSNEDLHGMHDPRRFPIPNVTRLFPKRRRVANANRSQGDTKTTRWSATTSGPTAPNGGCGSS